MKLRKALALVLGGAMVMGIGTSALATEEADHVKLGIQMYNFVVGGDWRAIDSQEGVEDLITELAQEGYEGLEWSNFQLGGEYLDIEIVKS